MEREPKQASLLDLQQKLEATDKSLGKIGNLLQARGGSPWPERLRLDETSGLEFLDVAVRVGTIVENLRNRTVPTLEKRRSGLVHQMESERLSRAGQQIKKIQNLVINGALNEEVLVKAKSIFEELAKDSVKDQPIQRPGESLLILPNGQEIRGLGGKEYKILEQFLLLRYQEVPVSNTEWTRAVYGEEISIVEAKGSMSGFRCALNKKLEGYGYRFVKTNSHSDVIKKRDAFYDLVLKGEEVAVAQEIKPIEEVSKPLEKFYTIGQIFQKGGFIGRLSFSAFKSRLLRAAVRLKIEHSYQKNKFLFSEVDRQSLLVELSQLERSKGKLVQKTAEARRPRVREFFVFSDDSQRIDGLSSNAEKALQRLSLTSEENPVDTTELTRFLFDLSDNQIPTERQKDNARKIVSRLKKKLEPIGRFIRNISPPGNWRKKIEARYYLARKIQESQEIIEHKAVPSEPEVVLPPETVETPLVKPPREKTSLKETIPAYIYNDVRLSVSRFIFSRYRNGLLSGVPLKPYKILETAVFGEEKFKLITNGRDDKELMEAVLEMVVITVEQFQTGGNGDLGIEGQIRDRLTQIMIAGPTCKQIIRDVYQHFSVSVPEKYSNQEQPKTISVNPS